MKKIIFPLSLLASVPTIAQEILPETYVQFAGNQYYGSARFQSLGGAMGALGADLSAMSVNPAGSALFNYSHFSLSGNLLVSDAENNYRNTTYSLSNSYFNMPNIGMVSVINKNKEAGITKVTWGLSYQNQQNYNSNTQSSGISNISGVNYFLEQANNRFGGGAVPYDNVKLQPGETLEGLYDFFNGREYGFASQQALLGYQGYLINEDGNGGYSSNMQPGTYAQYNGVKNYGYQGKISFNLATEIDKRYYLGANLNLHSISNERNSTFFERHNGLINTGVKSFEFKNYTYTHGTGFSLQLGAIARVSKQLRIGASYNSPTWMTLTDEFQQKLSSAYFDNGTQKYVIVDPNIITVFQPYQFRTPSSWTTSASYIFGKIGLLSVDYQYKDYSKMRFADNTGAFATLNKYYKNELVASHDLRIGGEIRINKMSIRAGYRNQTSPYKNTKFIGDYTSYSGGLGYSYGKSRLDFSYSYAHQDYKQTPLTSGISILENIKFRNHFVNITYSTSF